MKPVEHWTSAEELLTLQLDRGKQESIKVGELKVHAGVQELPNCKGESLEVSRMHDT